METRGVVRHMVLAFALAVGLYAASYSCDRHLRQRKGPWELSFGSHEGAGSLIINQPGLGISNVTLIFAGEAPFSTNENVVLQFDDPLKKPPHGKIIFHDLMYLPGTLTLELAGHEIELIPRTLLLNRREKPWKSGEIIKLTPKEKSSGNLNTTKGQRSQSLEK